MHQADTLGQNGAVNTLDKTESGSLLEQLFHSFSWWEFLFVVLFLAAIYFILFELEQLTKHSSFSGRYQNWFKELFHKVFVVYELLAIVISGGVFVWINPGLHGAILGFLILGSWSYLRSYISGRWLHFANDIKEGAEIQTGGLQGVVTKLGRVRLRLQTSEGLHHVGYNTLLEDGYTLVSGAEMGGFYHLELSPKADTNFSNHRLHLLDLFATAPYIDWHHKPEIFEDEAKENQVEARILIKEESHLYELMALIREWGYNCKLASI